ncbi:ABC transporter permease [Rhodococcoides yunnanense]|uniref:ABC transporter permease n=1 Tax=Rhodococcoides yunnanense TaxID=278209 RepID=UPI0009331155|nr:ABC transporter permease [Rhodococcus yunnanensis]
MAQLKKLSRPATFVITKVAAGVFVVWGAVTAVFFVNAFAGGNNAESIIGAESATVPGLREQVTAQYGLDNPLVEQYWDRMSALATGDLGWSYQRDEPVTHVLAGQVIPTLVLAGAAALMGLLLALCATAATVGRTGASSKLPGVIEILLVATPPFWTGIVLLTIFSFGLQWFPAFGATGPVSLVLPTVALALPIAGVLAQIMRNQLAEVDRSAFALSARARGLTERSVFWHHTLRHAMLPTLTLSAWTLGTLIGGAVLVEQVFSRPGLGRVLVDAVKGHDTPVVMAVVTISAIVFVIANTTADLVLPLIDPRVRDLKGADA